MWEGGDRVRDVELCNFGVGVCEEQFQKKTCESTRPRVYICATQMRICAKVLEIILLRATPRSNNCWYY